MTEKGGSPITQGTWVIKIGSSLVSDQNGLIQSFLDWFCGEIAELKNKGIDVVIVSSGAIAEGTRRLGLDERPVDLPMLQSAAAIGQVGLMHAYETRFQQSGHLTGMVLLTHDDLRDRERYLNARSTVETTIKKGVITVINENDSVSTDEIRFGDNDTLAARVASLIDADKLVLLTDQKGLCEQDPRINPEAQLVKSCSPFADKLDGMVNSQPGKFGRGGMLSKLHAARHAARSGCDTHILDGRAAGSLLELQQGNAVGTYLYSNIRPIEARKRWIDGQLNAKGDLEIDEGAANALISRGKSLLPIGIKSVVGSFHRGDLVRVIDPNGNQIAKGLSNYGDSETRVIMGHASSEIEALLGYMDQPAVIHRDNLLLS